MSKTEKALFSWFVFNSVTVKSQSHLNVIFLISKVLSRVVCYYSLRCLGWPNHCSQRNLNKDL